MTWRELAALREQWRSAREYQLIGFAAIQATLHNKWFERRDGRKFSPSDFMPNSEVQADDRTPEQLIEDQKMHILSVLQMAAAVNGVN